MLALLENSKHSQAQVVKKKIKKRPLSQGLNKLDSVAAGGVRALDRRPDAPQSLCEQEFGSVLSVYALASGFAANFSAMAMDVLGGAIEALSGPAAADPFAKALHTAAVNLKGQFALLSHALFVDYPRSSPEIAPIPPRARRAVAPGISWQRAGYIFPRV